MTKVNLRQITLTLLLLTGFGLAGCATSRMTKYEKSFKTDLTRANFSFNSSGLGSHIPIFYQVQVHCKEADCSTPEIALSFSLQSGSNDIYLNDLDLDIYTDGQDYHWPSNDNQRITHSPPVNGRFRTVSLTKEQLRHIAGNEKVKGNLAGNQFKWTYENRKPLRSLLKKLN